MKRLVFALLVSCSVSRAETIEALIEAGTGHNPELAFYEKQIAALPKPIADAPTIPQPLDFPGRHQLRTAIFDLDAPLANLHLERFRFVLAGEIRLKAMELQAASEIAGFAAELSDRISALVKMLEKRPAAGAQELIERRILEGAAFPFAKEASRARVEANRIRRELNGLLGREPHAELVLEGGFILPSKVQTPVPMSGSGNLLARLRAAEIERELSGLEAAEAEAFAVTPWFMRKESGDPLGGFTRPAGIGGSSLAGRQARLLEDARDKIEREQSRLLEASEADREIAALIPEKLIGGLKAAAELADRQYRAGALPVSLVLEVNREALNAIATRHEAFLRAWRSRLDAGLISLSTQISKTP